MKRIIAAIALCALAPAVASATEIGTALITLTEAEMPSETLAVAIRDCGTAWFATAEMDATGTILADTVEVTCHG